MENTSKTLLQIEVEELAETIAGKLTGQLLRRCGQRLFETENDDELPALKNFMRATILEQLSLSRLIIAQDAEQDHEYKQKFRGKL